MTATRPASERDELALVRDRSLPFLTTSHLDSHHAVLVRPRRLREMSRKELAEVM